MKNVFSEKENVSQETSGWGLVGLENVARWSKVPFKWRLEIWNYDLGIGVPENGFDGS